MPSVKTRLAGKAAKATARHSAGGVASKLRRDRVRSATLLGVGCAAGILVGWLLGAGLRRPSAGP